ncbi:MAG: ADP-forming succinate--CoA ligase subunit beta [Desulfurococcaceae archaeon]|jgi:succinyl-CoA synthetase beta subunit|nr:ADP-forming succinate--CoA ligase subunit beta [Desulfurococcaceae archaeon]MCC6053629.1 ADP-forming succinate--CoA ligase subunit beta [Desulfurococcaceae archaeon]
MKLYEYESKDIAKRYGVTTPRGRLVSTPEEAKRAASELGSVVIKAQVLVGGRGLAGGVKVAEKPEDAYAVAERLLSTSIRGERVEKLLVEEKVCISRELYLSLTVDRATRRPVYLVSEMGGVEIEELAKKYPEKIHRVYVDPGVGYLEYMSREAIQVLKLPWALLQDLSQIMRAMYNIMIDYDAELVEFNPLALTCDNKLVALDAKIIIDDNSLYRRVELQKLYGRDLSEYEKRAKELGFSYVELDGDIGVISNGAGLTMATMDSILYYGGKPANFLDIGGGARRESVKEAVKLMLNHPRSRVLLVNIFGGITRCDEVAAGIVEAIREVGAVKPIVVRMLGTNEEEGRRILREHGIEVYSEMDDAVKAAVEVAKR